MSTISAKISACLSGTSLTTQAQLHQNRSPVNAAPLSSSQLKVTQLLLCKNDGILHDQLSHSRTEMQQPPKPALSTLSFSFTLTPPRCLFMLSLFNSKITLFSLAFMPLLHNPLNIFKTLLIVSVSTQFNYFFQERKSNTLQ